MPDVWTTNPEKLRNFLEECGATCGVEGRVLTGRDAEWTCIYDSKGWLRDVYIHHWSDMFESTLFLAPVIMGAGIGVLVGLVWGRRFWRKT